MPNTKRAASKNKAFAQQRKENTVKKQSEKPIIEDAKIDAESFLSETDKFQSKKLALIRQKTGLLEKDKDRDIIQPLIQTHDNDDDQDDGYADETSIDRKLVKQTVDKVTKKQKDESDDEDDDETQLRTQASSEDDESEEEYKGAYSDDDESDEDISKLKKKALGGASSHATKWKRNEFYEGQTNVSQKTHTNRERKQFDEEEEEVKRMQEERAKRLTASDYLDDFMLDSKTTTSKKKTQETKKNTVSIEEKLAMIQKDAPEFMDLLVELKNKLVSVKDQLHPLLSKTEMGNLATSEGLSYLETKYHLMLSYCTNILFYVLLKSSGKSVKDHPVLDNLVELRLLLEKIKPIDERMKYQVDKLVKLANNIQDSTMTFDFKPNPDRLLKNDEEGAQSDEDSEMGESDEDLLEMTGGKARKLKTSFDSDSDEDQVEEDEQSTYVAPKMMAVSYDDSANRKSEKTRKKAMERIEKGSLLKELKNEFGDAPEESYSIGTEGRSKHLEAIEKAELESRQRLLLTRKDKKKIAEEMKIKDPLTEMDSYHEFTALQRYAKSKNATSSKLALAQYLGDADEAMKDISKGSNNNNVDEEERAMLESGALTYDSNSDFDEDDYEEEEDSHKRKRGGSDFTSKKQKRDYEDENLEYEGRDESGKRKADYTIVKNRGLAAHKKEDQRNPRLRLKNKYKAKTGGYRFGKVKSQAGYSGESKISTGVVKSRKIKS